MLVLHLTGGMRQRSVGYSCNGTNLIPLDFLNAFALHAFYHRREHQPFMEAAIAQIRSCRAILHHLNNFFHISRTCCLAVRCDQLDCSSRYTILNQIVTVRDGNKPADVQYASSVSRDTAHFHSGKLDTVRSDDVLDITTLQTLLGICQS
jgi:hypothetical protein